MQETPRGPYYLQDPEWYNARRPLILKARMEGQTLAAIGNTWGITRARVNQIIKDEHRRRGCAD
jgi:DNA-directed RNA polymerase sigma subunit (sigma70/sigma32)